MCEMLYNFTAQKSTGRTGAYIFFSGDKGVVNHYSTDDHQGAEAVDDNVFPVFFQKIAHFLFSTV